MSQRINVMISDEVNIKLNDLSKRYGMSKSSMCAFVIGQFLDTHERANSAIFGDIENPGAALQKLFNSMQLDKKK